MADKFSGVHWMLATPFKENEELDLESIGNLMEKAYTTGCEGVVALGVTGEAARLTDAERKAVAPGGNLQFSRDAGHPGHDGRRHCSHRSLQRGGPGTGRSGSDGFGAGHGQAQPRFIVHPITTV